MSNHYQSPPLLNVVNSVRGLRWYERNKDSRAALAISQRHSVPEIIGRLLAGRGVGPEGVINFLDPKLRDLMPDPYQLIDMDKAVERLLNGILNGEKIAIFGDYDVDGATSSALLRNFLVDLGTASEVYIPDRIKEGYGPNIDALEKLRAAGTQIVVMVDCGSSAHEALNSAYNGGLDVIVLDHHSVGPDLPKCYALVNPNRIDDSSGQGFLAAVGVTYLLVVALSRGLRQVGYYKNKNEPNLLELLDLVALGTVCDVVPLEGLNRALVRQGLKVLAKRKNKGIAALCDVAEMDSTPNSYHLGFVLGPRINAGGRVGKSDLGHRLLTSQDSEKAIELANQLNLLNTERKTIELLNVEQAIAQVEENTCTGSALVVYSDDWHIGVIGLVASRLSERYKKPSLVISLNGGIGKGSARSVPHIDIGSIVIAAYQSDIVTAGGGHPMAAGFTIDRARIQEFQKFVEKRIERQGHFEAEPTLSIDGVLSVSALNSNLIETFDQLGPFGAGNPAPRFAFSNVRVLKASKVGDGNHVRCILAGDEGGRLKGVAFRVADEPLGRAVLSARRLHVSGFLRMNNWGGRQEVELLIDDAAHPDNG